MITCISSLAVFVLLVSACPGQVAKKAAPSPATDAKLSSEQKRQIVEGLDTFAKSIDRSERRYLIEQVIGLGPGGARLALQHIDKQLASLRGKYTVALQAWLEDAYMRHLISLSDEQIMIVQRARRLWRSYVLHGGHRSNFQAEFLAPMKAAGEALLLRAEDVKDEPVCSQRKTLMELGEYQAMAHTALGMQTDPTVGKFSPTQIAYAPLDQPPTFLDSLHHTERSMVLAHTVAPPGAQAVLMYNDEAAQEIDVQEAEYVLFGNEMRMLSGTIVWRVDPLGNAVARDHSNDRTKGLATGHMSSIKEKRGFTDRSRRMGARRFGSEGVGGGASGRGYINGLSYGGGHTGPLYSLRRNCVGVGRRKNAYTSIYGTDRSIVHDCQAVANELVLPPGWSNTRLRGSARSIFSKLQSGEFGHAARALAKARPSNEKTSMLLRFFRAAVQTEIDWILDSSAAIEDAGDVYEARRRLLAGAKMFKGNPAFEEEGILRLAMLADPALAQALKAGEAFHRMVLGDLDGAGRAKASRALIRRYGGTAYAEAAKAADEPGAAFAYFVGKQATVEKYEYPPTAKR